MSKLLVIEDSIIVQTILKKLLDDTPGFDYDFASSYKEAKLFLSQRRYEYSVTTRTLKDAPNGEIIALLNKHNLAPIIFSSEINEDFFEDFEAAQIIEYIKKIKNKNEILVVQKLLQLKANKQITVLVVSDSKIYSTYLKQNLTLHNFKVFIAHNNEEAYEKLRLHPETSLLMIDSNEPYVKTLEIVEFARTQAPSQNLKIVVLSQESNSYFTSSMLHAGADDYLLKEFSRDEFYVRVYQNINKVC